MIYGYTRVSTRKQVDGYGLEAQRQEILSKYPNAYIFEEQYTGSKMERPIFTKLINQLKENDVLVVAKLDRFARTTIEGIKVVEELFKRKISIHILNVGLLEDTPMGRFFLTTMLAVAELERNMIIERTQSGKELARQDPNFKDGRPPKYPQEEL
jgi:DNA invertase Pin-like site-specific DNA recombinase